MKAVPRITIALIRSLIWITLLLLSPLISAQSIIPTGFRLLTDSLESTGRSEHATNTTTLVLYRDQTFTLSSRGPSCFTWMDAQGFWRVIADTMILQVPASRHISELAADSVTVNGHRVSLNDLRAVDEGCDKDPEPGVFLTLWIHGDMLSPVRCSRPYDPIWAFEEHYPPLILPAPFYTLSEKTRK